MDLLISAAHPTMQLKSKINQITANFFTQHGFNYFQYLRCYQNGSFGLLTNDTAVLEYVKNIKRNMQVVYSSHTAEHEKLYSYWFLWDEELPDFPVQLAKDLSSLHHGITFVRRTRKYYDMIAFALPQRINNVASFYLTKQKAMQAFIDFFDHSHSDLIEVMEQNPISLAKPFQDINCHKMCLHKSKIHIESPSGVIHITSQELACLRLLAQGITYKEIAHRLALSSRTVETYIARLKQRSGIANKTALKNLLASCQ